MKIKVDVLLDYEEIKSAITQMATNRLDLIKTYHWEDAIVEITDKGAGYFVATVHLEAE